LHPALAERHKITGEVAYLELDAQAVLEAVGPRAFAGLERFPSTQRDITVVLPATTTWAQVEAALADLPGTRVDFVGDYTGRGVPDDHKSLTMRLTLAHPDRTPTETEGADTERKALAILARKFKAQLRG
jgi:phenylalanyl-tRNA synthetase beta chain